MLNGTVLVLNEMVLVINDRQRYKTFGSTITNRHAPSFMAT